MRDGCWRRCLDKRKGLDVAETERLHAQDDFSEIGALDFRLGERRAGVEILLGIQPDADAGFDATGAAFALVGAALRNGFHGQPPGAGARVVAADAGEAGVDDVADAGNGERGLGDVPSDDNFAPGRTGKYALLIAGTKAAKERDDFRLAVEAAFELVARLADVAFARHEDEHVAEIRFAEDALGRLHGGIDEADVAALFRRGVEQ